MLYNRTLCSEAPFIVATLMAVSCMVLAMSGRRLWLWLCLGGIATGLAIVTRLVGVVLLTPALLFISATVLRSIRRHDGHGLMQDALPWVSFIALALVPLTAWTIRNAVVFDYPRPTDIGPLTRLDSMTSTGLMDMRSITDPRLYETLVRGRYSSNYGFEGWAFTFAVAPWNELEKMPRPDAEREYDRRVNMIADRNDALIPTAAKAATLLRGTGWLTWFLRNPNFQPSTARHLTIYECGPEQTSPPTTTLNTTSTPHSLFGTRSLPCSIVCGIAWPTSAGPCSDHSFCLDSQVSSTVHGGATRRLTSLLMIHWANIILIAILGVTIPRYSDVLLPLLTVGVACAISSTLQTSRPRAATDHLGLGRSPNEQDANSRLVPASGQGA
jgi:hypothetical protein